MFCSGSTWRFCVPPLAGKCRLAVVWVESREEQVHTGRRRKEALRFTAEAKGVMSVFKGELQVS